MKRFVYAQLLEWKQIPDDERKPLILEGARQVGKTWLARELGRNGFENYIELNFEKQTALRALFEFDFDFGRILLAISAFSGQKVIPGKTLLFLDEVQWAPRGLLSLKYFKEDLPGLHVIAAGSLLGLLEHEGESFPVGKVSFLRVFPMTFDEFLTATGKESLYDVLKKRDWTLTNVLAARFEESLRSYYYVGGMPEAVEKFITTRDYSKVRKVQRELIASYKRDFSKHAPGDVVPRISLVWDSIPTHLAKDNKKFVYAVMKSGARAREYETAIKWLADAGLVHKHTRVSKGEMPLDGFEDTESFKLFVLDVGILGAMCSLDRRTLLNGSEFYGQYKGALTEQYVLQELICRSTDEDEVKLHYWAPDTGQAEVDFVIQAGGQIAPLEAKAEISVKAKSLKVFSSRYRTPRIFRTSLLPYFEGENVTDIPLYAVSKIPDIMRENLPVPANRSSISLRAEAGLPESPKWTDTVAGSI